MKAVTLVGAVLILLGALSFVVPIPHHEGHSVKIGGAKVGIETQSSDKVPTSVSVLMLAAGIATILLGSRQP